jgi:hypothetical protein
MSIDLGEDHAAWRKDQESQEEKLREIMVAGSEC